MNYKYNLAALVFLFDIKQTLHVIMVYQQESEISQSHAMALLTEYISLYLSNIIYSSYISDRANKHVVCTSQREQ